MPPTVLIIANDNCPTHSLLTPCLEDILGDPALLWQLRAIPEGIERVCIITGNDHEKISGLVARWKQDGEVGDGIECRRGSDIMDSSPNALFGSTTHVLLWSSRQPLVSRDEIRELVSAAGAVIKTAGGESGPLRHGVAPVLLPLAVFQAAEGKNVDQIVESDLNALLEPFLLAAMPQPGFPQPSDFPGKHHFLGPLSDAGSVRPQIIQSDRIASLSIHTRRGLAETRATARERIVNHWLDKGVAFMDPDSVFIGPRVVFAERGVSIEPHVRIEGRTVVGEGVKIGQGSIVKNTDLGKNVEIRPYCVIDDATIGDGAKIGPFAHLRPETRLEPGVHLGNFVETKNAHLFSGAKANHLSYLGDCEIGEKTNIGAGCITCNYDGFKKHRTVIGKKTFIGSDCQLVAPVTIGDGAILGAGTTLTKDAPEDALVLTRPPTSIKEGGAKRLRAKLGSVR